MSATNDPVTSFVAALRDADATMTALRGRLAAARVHDDAFGRLFEAHAVRDTYHQRLPEMARNFDEARAVLDHFITGLEGGHRIEPVPIPEQTIPGQTIPEQAGGSAS